MQSFEIGIDPRQLDCITTASHWSYNNATRKMILASFVFGKN